MPIAKLVMSEEEQGLVSQKVKVKRKELRIKFQDFIQFSFAFCPSGDAPNVANADANATCFMQVFPSTAVAHLFTFDFILGSRGSRGSKEKVLVIFTT
ncbi:hypothetical protein H6G93_31670 [Nostoc sp. FACHB-973]|nr:hypothetical protein [Nostoc sp. FACHB-973]